MKRAGVIIGIVLIGIAYVVGFWPQYQKAQEAQRQLAAVTIQLNNVQAQVRLCRLQDHLLALIGKASAKNYGDAAKMSTQFFDEVRREATRRPSAKEESVLESILQQRDAVTSALAKGDPGAVDLLNTIEATMFNLVDESVGGGTGASSTAPGQTS